MTKEGFFKAMADIREEYINEAKMVIIKPMGGKRQKPIRLKWGAIAACLCLGLLVSVSFFIEGNGGPDSKDTVPPLHMIEYNGAYYEQIDLTDTKVLAAYGLPYEITEDMVGKALGNGWAEDGRRTEQTFYQYVPYADIVTVTGELEQKRAQRAVYVLEEDGEYSFALFCNFLMFDSNTHTEVSEMFAVYGIDEAADIASLTMGGEQITDPERIRAVFDALCQADAMGNDDYQAAIFGGKSEAEQQALSVKLADSAIRIRITTKEGIVTSSLYYYSTIRYVSWALNYYKLDRSIT